MSDDKTDASIIDPKYRDRYKGGGDWLSKWLTDQVSVSQTKEVEVKDEEGNVTGTETKVLKKRAIDLDALFAISQRNGIDTDKYEEQRDRKNAPGRLRMTLGNMLRARAVRRGGLYDAGGEWHDAPNDFETKITEDRDGVKLAKAEPEAETEAA